MARGYEDRLTKSLRDRLRQIEKERAAIKEALRCLKETAA